MSNRRAVVLALCAVLLAASACISRPVRRDVFKEGGLEVYLRSEVKTFGGGTVARDFEHPLRIAAVRVAHILSRIDVRLEVSKGNARVPFVPTDILYPIAEGIARALDRATPDEEVVVMAVRRTKRFYLFDRNYLTSFVVYSRGEQLYVHLARTDWEIPARRKEKLPEPRTGEHPMKFRVYPGTAMTMLDRQSLAIDWDDPIFREPTRTRMLPSGEVVQKTILMESDPAEWEENRTPTRSRLEDLSPDQLRELADLEERRQRGQVSESEYHAQRQRILKP